jgi:hypothetical protein
MNTRRKLQLSLFTALGLALAAGAPTEDDAAALLAFIRALGPT